MKTKLIHGALALAVIGALLVSRGEARNVRATDMTADQWASIGQAKAEELQVEFRQGDEIPVHLSAQGDLFESTRTEPTYVRVKRDFWIRLRANSVQISFDGQTFHDIPDVLKGAISADAGAPNGGVAHIINVVFKAEMK